MVLRSLLCCGGTAAEYGVQGKEQLKKTFSSKGATSVTEEAGTPTKESRGGLQEVPGSPVGASCRSRHSLNLITAPSRLPGRMSPGARCPRACSIPKSRAYA
eukprot:scaffold1786_cov398-Prasinococcus_capsulatus_cf.AAC.19